jgi:hypothetical protein
VPGWHAGGKPACRVPLLTKTGRFKRPVFSSSLSATPRFVAALRSTLLYEGAQPMLKLFVRNLPPQTTEAGLKELFTGYGKVFELQLSRDMFTGKARGTASVSMEGHEARKAIEALDGSDYEGKTIYVALDKGPRSGGRGRR